MEAVRIEREGSVAVVCLARPHRANALTMDVERQLGEAVARCSRDEDVAAIVLAGDGRHFCAGADLELLKSAAGSEHVAYAPETQTRFLYLTRVPKPIVCAVQGAAYGAGLVLALYCDIRLAAASAVFKAPFADLGLAAEMGIAWHLPRLVGLGRSLEWMMGGMAIDADEAFRVGLVNRVLPDEGFRQSVVEVTRTLFEGRSRTSLATIKSQLWSAFDRSLPDDAVLAGLHTEAALNSTDFRARARALPAGGAGA